MALFDPSIFDPSIFDTAQLASSTLPLPPFTPPIPRRRRYEASIPIATTIRRPTRIALTLQTMLRTPIHATLSMQRPIRRQFTESFVTHRVVVTEDVKRMLRGVYEFLKEDQL